MGCPFSLFSKKLKCVSLQRTQSRSLLPSTFGEAWTFQIICNVISGIGLLQTLWVVPFFWGKVKKNLKKRS